MHRHFHAPPVVYIRSCSGCGGGDDGGCGCDDGGGDECCDCGCGLCSGTVRHVCCGGLIDDDCCRDARSQYHSRRRVSWRLEGVAPRAMVMTTIEIPRARLCLRRASQTPCCPQPTIPPTHGTTSYPHHGDRLTPSTQPRSTCSCDQTTQLQLPQCDQARPCFDPMYTGWWNRCRNLVWRSPPPPNSERAVRCRGWMELKGLGWVELTEQGSASRSAVAVARWLEGWALEQGQPGNTLHPDRVAPVACAAARPLHVVG